MPRRLSNVIGFDDGPFDRERRRGSALLVGAVCARTRLDGVVAGRVRHDGWNATDEMVRLIRDSPFNGHVRAVLLGGIAVAGFNVVDVHRLAAALERPVVVVARRPPRLEKMRAALTRLPGGDRRWRLIEAAGPMEPIADLYIQRVGLTTTEARDLLAATTLHGHMPEPLRLAHIIAGGVTTGHSRGRA